MMRARPLLIGLLLALVSGCPSSVPQRGPSRRGTDAAAMGGPVSTPKEQVDIVLQRVAKGQLSPPASMEQDGWEMKLSNGQTTVRSRLQAEARPLIGLGPAAVPPL